jgi:hypothetical protein
MRNLDFLTKTKSLFISLFIYFLFTIGVSLQIGGSNWDIVWHGSKSVESFLTPPHAVIYSGVALTLCSLLIGLTIYGQIIRSKYNKKFFPFTDIFKKNSLIPFALKLVFVGAMLQITAGPFDFWWHTNFGFDGLLSPPHSVLVTGMFLVAIGGLVGIFNYLKSSFYSTSSSKIVIPKMLFLISCGVTLMVAVDIVFLFTLPFSKGQYFNFNPEPFSAIFIAIIFMPFIMSTITSSISLSLKIPFTFTSIASVIIIIQAASTIISNSYFFGIFPYYMLNILPALIIDLTLLKLEKINNQSKIDDYKNAHNKRYGIASIVFSLFFISLFFPWTVDVFGGFFHPSNEIRTEEFLLQILFPIILPIVIPISIISSYLGTIFSKKVIERYVKI